MKKFFFLFLFVCVGLQAHFNDTFDANGQIIATHDGADVDARNRYRKAAFFETTRLRFVPVTPNHGDAFLIGLFDDARVMTYYEQGVAKDNAYVKRRLTGWVNRFDESPFSWWALYTKEGNQFIGAMGCGLNNEGALEVACLLKHDVQRQGYMSEAFLLGFGPYVKQVLKSHPDIKCTKIFGPIDPQNKASIALAQKLAEQFGGVNDKAKDYMSQAYGKARTVFEISTQKLFEGQ